MITIDQMIACVSREVAMRKRVYPGLVMSERMTDQKSQHEIDAMEAVLELLKTEKRKTEPELL